MSMNLKLLRVTDKDIARLETQPEDVEGFINAGEATPNRGAEYLKAREELARQMGIKLPNSPASDFDTYPFDEGFDARKMWQALYFLLTGSGYGGEPPAAWLLNSPPIGEDAFGYGPAMAISATNTQILSDYLDKLDRGSVLNRFDGAEMMGLNFYPNIWDEDEGQLKSELGATFDRLRIYCRKCAGYKLGMLSYII